MENINFNKILNRENIENNICDILKDFEINKKNLQQKRGIYLYGDHGIGKTIFIKITF